MTLKGTCYNKGWLQKEIVPTDSLNTTLMNADMPRLNQTSTVKPYLHYTGLKVSGYWAHAGADSVCLFKVHAADRPRKN